MKMAAPMELPVFTTYNSIMTRTSLLCHSSSMFLSNHHHHRHHHLHCLRLSYGSISKRFFGISMSTAKNCFLNDQGHGSLDSGFIDVIVIGSRKDAVLDFSLNSPFRSSQSLRFWTILARDSDNVQLEQRQLGKDFGPASWDALPSQGSSSKTVILVASAGYGLDHMTAIDILKETRSAHGLAVAIILKPFSFEGQRREDEVNVLLGSVQEHATLCIDIATDMLLQKDSVTLDEAMKTANNAVLLAINAISVLTSEMHTRTFSLMHDNSIKELRSIETVKIMERHKEAKIGFGAGNKTEASILQAIFDCPFIGVGLKNLNGSVVCIFASSGVVNDSDLVAFGNAFRRTAEFDREIIICGVHEPNLQPGLLVTTVIALGCIKDQTSPQTGVWSRLAEYFPFVFDLLKIDYNPQTNEARENDLIKDSVNDTKLPESGGIRSELDLGNVPEVLEKSEESKAVLSSNFDDICDQSRDDKSLPDQGEVGFLAAETEFSDLDGHVSEGIPVFERETPNHWNLGPGYLIAQEWAKARATDLSAIAEDDNLSPFHIPVGVRCSDVLKDGISMSSATGILEPKSEDVVKELVSSSMAPLGALTDAGFEALRDFCNNASTMIKGSKNSVPEKQGGLSIRAASMLEAERESPKKWNPLVEIQYRGGVYKGRCQGGLPEGKGRLILGDGSIYDGMWRYGKRYGSGTFYFSTGDVFQGSWRDDAMHGKGWFYFHTGDRWFANFWKGKANGEGRFYSKSGNVLFGHFQDGWRHGQFLCIDVDGARTLEIWDDGVLVNQKQLKSGAE